MTQTIPTPYQRIMKAARAGNGLKLSADEVRTLSMDDAIEYLANNDDRRDEEACQDNKPARAKT